MLGSSRVVPIDRNALLRRRRLHTVQRIPCYTLRMNKSRAWLRSHMAENGKSLFSKFHDSFVRADSSLALRSIFSSAGRDLRPAVFPYPIFRCPRKICRIGKRRPAGECTKHRGKFSFIVFRFRGNRGLTGACKSAIFAAAAAAALPPPV